MSLAIGIDIGGTKVLGGVVAEDGTVVASHRIATPATDVAAIRTVIVDLVRRLSAAHEVIAVGIGAAGWIDATRSTVQFSPNLAWRHEPLREGLSRDIDVPVVVENDANVAMWAEYRYGAARGVNNTALFTVGTGIGGGLISDGRLVRGAHGVAAEFGHVRVVPDGIECGCGRRGCLEQYASGTALVREAKRLASCDEERAVKLLELAGGDPNGVDGPMVTEAARDGDPVALAAFAHIGTNLGSALIDLVQVADPEIIVIGGGVVNAGDLLLDPIREHYGQAMGARGELQFAQIKAAQMGANAGLVGAADLARQ
ncbi:MAG TPA: ROK family glucokinase [Candidatus Stackebrandtia faecavium]|nr:ROK family glucokinase [Candidatus Stackebrandtia faecavium]